MLSGVINGMRNEIDKIELTSCPENSAWIAFASKEVGFSPNFLNRCLLIHVMSISIAALKADATYIEMNVCNFGNR